MIFRIFVEKKKGLSPAEEKLKNDIHAMLGIKLSTLRRILRYDVEGISKEDFEKAVYSVFAESPVDEVFYEIEKNGSEKMLIVEFLPGQFDQRADSAMQCVQLLTAGARPLIRCATVYIIGGVDEAESQAIKKFLINPVESREGSEILPKTLKNDTEYTFSPDIIEGFIGRDESSLSAFYDSFGFAMTKEDLAFVQSYFKGLKREPTLTELKVIDTYWSDHCRHTTFLTEITDAKIVTNIAELEDSYKNYCKLFGELYAGRTDKYKCLMDIATIAAKQLKKDGYLDNLDISEEINACSVRVNVDIDGKDEEWLIMFKNETHNHPTEIEPFGGAATCLGGAIRDPLSGRSYVYQAMRVTGSGSPLERIEDTIPGKLPQRVITKTAAAGFSSYGNQIGLATGIVKEIYHDGYKAKRLETGYVIGGAPLKNVKRETPKKGDIIILLGGDTGRDGCGGATGSSKSHTVSSVELCGAEVQKGNAPEERKIQRFFRDERVSTMIKKCNDFGAGGVCVAIGELAEGLDIFLHKVPKKNSSLTPTELAISESQERMAVVVEARDAEAFIAAAFGENLKATVVAEVTDTKRLRMFYEENTVVDVEREFLDTNGVKQVRSIKAVDNYDGYFEKINAKTAAALEKNDIKSAIENELSRLEVCSTKGLGEKFDSTIGAASVLMPFGGKNQITPSTAMAAKPPVLDGYTTTVTVSSCAYYPHLMSESVYVGSIYSVVGSLSKQIATGASYSSIRLTFQEYFKRLGSDAERWGTPFAALLGAFEAQSQLKVGAIGGKDSMSGSFESLDVPPTLISFAMGIAKENDIRHNAWEEKGNVYFYKVPANSSGIPDYKRLLESYAEIEGLIKAKKIKHTAVVEDGGIIAAAAVSLFANNLGIEIDAFSEELFKPYYGGILVVADSLDSKNAQYIGRLNDKNSITVGGREIKNDSLIKAYTGTLSSVFKTEMQPTDGKKAANSSFSSDRRFASSIKKAKPRVFIPVFPGTNCEYDTARAFEASGAKAEIFVIKNYSSEAIAESIDKMKEIIASSQIIAFPGGFSGGDEPDGSGKFIATTFKNPYLKEALMDLLYNRDGLALGICNGFQALIKLGLLPYGRVIDQSGTAPTLTFNNIAKHISAISRIRIASNNSPWLQGFGIGDVYNVPISHGEGKFICGDEELLSLERNGQIATQYVDLDGNSCMTSPFNPNGSYNAVEGILSPDGRVFGKMGHTERAAAKGLYKNVSGNYDMDIFSNGVRYYL